MYAKAAQVTLLMSIGTLVLAFGMALQSTSVPTPHAMLTPDVASGMTAQTARALTETASPVPEPTVIVKGDEAAFDVRAFTTDPSRCPFTAAEGAYIVDFTRGGTVAWSDRVVSAADTRATLVTPVVPIVPAGSYRVTVASQFPQSDGMSGQSGTWQLALFTDDAQSSADSHPTRALMPGERVSVEQVGVVTVPTPVTSAGAVYATNALSSNADVVPVCAMLAATTPEQELAHAEHSGVVESSRCPIPKRDRRIIVDFTTDGPTGTPLRADIGSSEASSDEVPMYVPEGSYTIRLAGLRPDSAWVDDASWYATAYNSAGESVVTTESVGIPAWEDEVFVSKLPEPVTLTADAVRIRAHHGAFPNLQAPPVTPVCVSFDPIL